MTDSKQSNYVHVADESRNNEILLLASASNDPGVITENDIEVSTVNGNRKWYHRLRKNDKLRRKLVRTTWLCLSFFTQGLGMGIRGPALMDLQLITNASVQQASAFFTASAVGFIIGSIVAGVVYDLMSKLLLLVLCLVAVAAFTAATPFCTNYWLMVAVNFLGAFFGGGIDTAANANMMRTWSNPSGKKKAQATAMQTLHFVFSVGALVGPLIVEPFLAPSVNLEHTAINNLSITDSSSNNQFLSETLSLNYNLGNSSNNSSPNNGLNDVYSPTKDSLLILSFDNGIPGVNASAEASGSQTRVHYAFIICAFLSVLSAVPLSVDYACQKNKKNRQARKRGFSNGVDRTMLPQIEEVKKCMEEKEQEGRGKECVDDDDDNDNEEEEEEKTNDTMHQKKEERGDTDRFYNRGRMPRSMYIMSLLWLCSFYLLYNGVEDTFSFFLTYFVVHEVEWSKSQGALLTFAFWMSFAACRLVSILLVMVLSHVQLITACFAVLLTSMAAFLLSSIFNASAGLWISTTVGGAAMGPLFPCVLSWADNELLPMTGRATSAIMLASAGSSVINPLLVGYLMDYHGTIFFAYVFLGEAIVSVFTFVTLLLFCRLFLLKKYHLTTREEIIRLE